jgi:hypothetical protein
LTPFHASAVLAVLALVTHGSVAAQAAVRPETQDAAPYPTAYPTAHPTDSPPAVPSRLAPAPPPAQDPFALPLADPQPAAGVDAGQPHAQRWKQQVVQLILEERGRAATGQVLSLEPAPTKFALAFAEAKVPDCLHKDGLKRQPPRIGPFVFMGVIALPFVALAKVRGKCI